MKLDAFRFRYVGPFGAEGIDISGLTPGLNVIAEHNERGKSSLLAALETVLFLPHTSWKGDAKSLARDDGSPSGEIDFTVAGTPYRLSKTFRSGKTATLINRETGALIAKKREAEERVTELLGLGTSGNGPSGLLWVRQGNSMEAAQDDGQVASRLESELSTLVGGDRARAYLERTELALHDLVTKTGRVKTGGPLAASEDALATAEAALERAKAALSATQQFGLDLGKVTARMESLSQESGEDDVAQIAAARAALETAKLAQSAMEKLRSDAARRAGESERAQEKLGAHLASVRAYDEASGKIDAHQAALTKLNADLAAAEIAGQAVSSELSALSDQRDALDRAERAADMRQRLGERNAALQAVLNRLEEWDSEAARKTDLIAARDGLPPVTRDGFDQLTRLDRDRDAATRDLAGLQATLTLDLDAGVSATLDGQPVASGRVRLTAANTLSLPGASLRLDTPEADALRSAKARADEAFTAQLERQEVESLDAAAAALRERADVDRDIALIDRQMERIAPDGHSALIDAQHRLQADVSRLAEAVDDAAVAEADPDVDPAQLTATLAQLAGEQKAGRAQIDQMGRDKLRLEIEAKGFQTTLSASPPTARPDARNTALTTLSSEAAIARQQEETSVTALQDATSRAPSDPALIEAKLQRLLSVQNNRAAELAELREQHAALSAQRRQVFDNQDPEAEAERLDGVCERLRDEVRTHRRRAGALALLRDTLKSSQSELQDRYTEPVRKELAPLLSQVIDGAEAELSETLGATGLRRPGGDDTLERLSGGTREQIAVLTRLAFARLLARGGQPCPVILDDALVYADDGRREAMFDVLNYVAQGEPAVQLLYLSCHETASRKLGGTRLTLKPWPEN